MIKDGGYAFPTKPGSSVGMTLRDWFAGQALQGMMANQSIINTNGLFNISNFKEAYKAADAMIAEREKSHE